MSFRPSARILHLGKSDGVHRTKQDGYGSLGGGGRENCDLLFGQMQHTISPFAISYCRLCDLLSSALRSPGERLAPSLRLPRAPARSSRPSAPSSRPRSSRPRRPARGAQGVDDGAQLEALGAQLEAPRGRPGRPGRRPALEAPGGRELGLGALSGPPGVLGRGRHAGTPQAGRPSSPGAACIAPGSTISALGDPED